MQGGVGGGKGLGRGKPMGDGDERECGRASQLSVHMKDRGVPLLIGCNDTHINVQYQLTRVWVVASPALWLK